MNTTRALLAALLLAAAMGASPHAAAETVRAPTAEKSAKRALSVSISGPQFIQTQGSYEWEAVPSGGNGTYSYSWTLEQLNTQPEYWGSGSSVGMYVDSESSPYLYWTVTVTSGSETAYAEMYVCNFTASAMC